MYTSIDELYALYLKHPSISTDSRQIKPGCLFFALKGENFDGNSYAEKALSSGAAYAVIDNETYAGSHTLLVENVLTSLQQLSQFHRRKFDIPFIAITGSNGKTTTKELMNAVLSQHYRVTATKGNYNNHIGVPLTLLEVSDKTQIAIIEMGANHQGEIAELCRIAEPTHGLITNIGKAHLEGFGGIEGVIKAKSELYNWLRAAGGHIFVNADNSLLMDRSSGTKRILYGTGNDNFIQGSMHEGTSRLELDWISRDGKLPVKTMLVGNYNFENVLAAICTGAFFEVPAEKIVSGINNYTPSNSRSQSIKTSRNTIIMDAYNANPTSMQLAIENFSRLDAVPKMVILGDMLELGDESLPEHEAIVKLVTEKNFETVVLVGPDFVSTAKRHFHCFKTSDEAYLWLNGKQFSGYTILIKGSRGIKLEKVMDAL